MYIFYALLVMFLVTYLPRVVPLCIFKKEIKSRFVKSFLYYTPYGVLAALTFPAIFYATGNLYTAINGTAVALVLSFFKVNMALVAVVCVGVVFGFSFVF